MVLSLSVFLNGFDLIPFLSQIYKPLGVLYIVFVEMFNDVFTWLYLFGIITISFCLTLVGLQKSGYYQDVEDGAEYQSDTDNLSLMEVQTRYDVTATGGATWAPLWAVFGEFNAASFSPLAAILMWMFIFVGSVVLVNLLVAMFADTYTKIYSRSEVCRLAIRTPIPTDRLLTCLGPAPWHTG